MYISSVFVVFEECSWFRIEEVSVALSGFFNLYEVECLSRPFIFVYVVHSPGCCICTWSECLFYSLWEGLRVPAKVGLCHTPLCIPCIPYFNLSSSIVEFSHIEIPVLLPLYPSCLREFWIQSLTQFSVYTSQIILFFTTCTQCQSKHCKKYHTQISFHNISFFKIINLHQPVHMSCWTSVPHRLIVQLHTFCFLSLFFSLYRRENDFLHIPLLGQVLLPVVPSRICSLHLSISLFCQIPVCCRLWRTTI